MNIKDLKKQGRELKPVINIGKNGLTHSQVEHIKRILQKKKLIKVKFNRSALDEKDKQEIVAELLDNTDAILVDFIGFNAVIYKERR